MKTKNLLSIFVLLAFAFFATFSISSCSDDDDNKQENNTDIVENYSSKNFVGRWKCEEYDEYDGNWINILTFKSDGTGLYEEYDKWENEVGKFRYTIDSKNDKLLLYYDDGEYERWEIDLVTSKYLILDGDRYDRQ